MQWKRSYVENRGFLNLSDDEIFRKFKELRGLEVSQSSSKKNETMISKYGKKSLASAQSARKGWCTYLNNQGVAVENLSEEEVKFNYYSRVSLNQIQGRGKTVESRRESYRRAIAVKGRYMAERRGIDVSGLTEEELMKFSGLQKKENYATLTVEKQKEYRRTWKITHLRNYFGNIFLWEKESDETLREWYHRYLFASGRLGTPKTLKSKKGKTGWVDIRWGRFFTRSSYEKRLLLWANANENISFVEGNLPGIPYIYEDRNHYYFPDFILTTRSNKRFLVEVKAAWMLNDSQTKAKLAIGKEFAQNQKLTWVIITEKELEELDDTFFSKAE